MKREMETDEDHATMRESFSLVQNILFIEFIDVVPAHVKENMVEKLWKADAIWFGFLIAYFGGNLWCPYAQKLSRNLFLSIFLLGGPIDL